MSFWKWSRTASANANADASVNWAEGMPPSAVNDSGRAMMAAAAKYRDDLSGVIVTAGTATAYTVSSYQVFDTLAHLDGKVIAFTPHVTNDAGPTLNVDGLGAKPLRAAHGADLQSNVLLSGTPYVALYNNANAEFVLQGMTANPYGIPLAGGLDYWADTTPGSAYAFPTGQAISRTAYAALFNLVGTKFGTGDGSTTFNLPDKTGRASVMIEGTATRLTSNYFGGDSTKIGATGGGESVTLATGNLPPYTPTGTVNYTQPTWEGPTTRTQLGVITNGLPANQYWSGQTPTALDQSIGPSFVGNPQGGTSTPLRTVPPSIVCNYIMRII